MFIIRTLLTLIPFFSQATTYYISSSGDDTNSGTAISTPWKSLDKVNSFLFTVGDSILFKRGETWRGQLMPASGNTSSDVYYGAYSNGSLPIILGSLSINNTSQWTNVNGNIWKCNENILTDVGNIIFDNATSVGFKKWNFNDLQNQNDFCIIYQQKNFTSIQI